MLRSINDSIVPLKSQHLHIDVCDRNASCVLTQNYVNEEENPIEAFFTFPTPAEAAVYSFEAKTDNGIIVAQIKEKQQAKKEYNDAIKTGNTAYYMDRSDCNMFSVAVGNLAALTGVQITIKFATELHAEKDGKELRLNIPLTIVTRYTPLYQYTSKKFVSSVANPSRTNEKPYNMSVSGTIFMNGGLASVNSKTHKIKLSKMREYSANFEVDDLENLDKDMVLTFEREHLTTSAVAQELKSLLKNPYLRYCTCVRLVPDFSILPPININDCHYCILLDKSGSMEGKSIEILKTAAQNFVAFIPNDATFDVYTFDNTFKKFECKDEDKEAMGPKRKQAASLWISNINADGGTELLPVLKHIYSNLNKRKNSVLIVITDGEITNTHDVLKLVKSNPNTSVFSIGIGSCVSQDLIKGLATNGNGYAEFIGEGDKDLVQKVRDQLKKSQDTLRKHQNDYALFVDTTGGSYRMVPNELPPLYEQVDNTLYIFSEFLPIRIRYVTQGHNLPCMPISASNEQVFTPFLINDQETVLHRIAGIKLLNELQTQEEYDCTTDTSSGSLIDHMQVDTDTDNDNARKHRQEMISVSTDLNILSNYTAFIGVDHKIDKVTGKMEMREVPLQIAAKERNEMKSMCNGTTNFCSFNGGGCNYMGQGKMYFSENIDEIDTFESFDVDSFREVSCNTPPNISKVTSMQDMSDTPTTTVLFVTTALNGLLLGGGLLTSKTNESLVELLKKLLNLQFIDLKVGDVISLNAEIISSTNGLYKIVNLGSVNDPWVLQLC